MADAAMKEGSSHSRIASGGVEDAQVLLHAINHLGKKTWVSNSSVPDADSGGGETCSTWGEGAPHGYLAMGEKGSSMAVSAHPSSTKEGEERRKISTSMGGYGSQRLGILEIYYTGNLWEFLDCPAPL
jgi:hypothetical protein